MTRAPHADAMPGPDLVDWRQDTLVDALRLRAADQPDLVLYTFLEDGESRERSITAGQLDADARVIGRALARLAAPGDRVVLLYDDGLDTIAGLFGCLVAGLAAVSGIHPAAPRSTERLLGILRDSGATVVLGQARVLAQFQRDLDDVLDELDLRWVASDTLRRDPNPAWAGAAAANQGLALVQYTSGSTREPRGVMLTHRNILHNLDSQLRAFGYRPGDTGVSWLPFSHDMGLIGCVLMAVYGGGRCVLLSPSHFLEDPSRWLRAISRYRAALSGGPTFAYDLCARRADAMLAEPLDLSSWTVAVSGAEPVRAEVMRGFAEAFAPAGFRAEAIRPSYGLAEATLLVTCGDRLAPLETRRLDRAGLHRDLAIPVADGGAEVVGCGRNLADQALAIVDPRTLVPVEPGRIGEIWVAGPSISSGYLGRVEENRLLFAGDLGDGRGPYLRTGDLGFVLGEELFVTGRLRDLIVLRGKNLYPQDLEHSAEASHPAVRPGCSACFMDPETGGLVVVSELMRAAQADCAAAASAIRSAIVCQHGANPQRIVLVGWGSVLKTPSGKIQRSHTRAALAEGRLQVLHVSDVGEHSPAPEPSAAPIDMTRIEDWFLARIGRMGLDPATLDPSVRLSELGFDSLKIVELKAELERDLGIAIPIADLYAFEDLKSLADHLRTALLKPADRPPAGEVAAPPSRPRSRLAEQRRPRGAAVVMDGGPLSL